MSRALFHALCALLAALCAVLLVAVALAAPGCEGHVRPRPAASFWCPRESWRVVGGEVQYTPGEDGGPAVLRAQGWWHSVEVDGVAVIEAVYLPVVRDAGE